MRRDARGPIRDKAPSRYRPTSKNKGSDVGGRSCFGRRKEGESEHVGDDEDEKLWRKGLFAAFLFCIVAIFYFALFSIMQAFQLPIYGRP